MNRGDLPLTPCPLVWDELVAEGPDRRCDTCRKTVIDLSARTERDARRALRSAADPCVAYRTDDQGTVQFAPSRRRRWARRIALGVLALVTGAAEASDVRVGTGREPPPPAVQTIDFGQLAVAKDLHPRRFPHGPHGPSWISVGAGLRGAAFKRVVLKCTGLREPHPFPDQGYTRFEHLPEGLPCELRFRGGDERLDVPVTTGSTVDGVWFEQPS